MSSCLCNGVAGGVFPWWVHAVEDPEHDAVYAPNVDAANHRPGAPADLHEAALNDVGGAQLAPQVPGEVEEAEQLRQVFLPLEHDRAIGLPPVGLELLEGALRLPQALGAIDGLGLRLRRVVVALPHLLQDVAHLVHPAALLRCWAMRIADLKNDLRFRYITVFRNRGDLAGQQIRHPHSELTATTFIPRRIVYELRASKEYYEMKERCVFCDIGQQEEQQSIRVVDLTPRYLAFCPFAARVPFELCILPRYHHASFETDVLRHSDPAELAGILQRTLSRLEQLTQDYHLVLHTSPNTRSRTELGQYWTTIDDDYHWHIEILPITEKQSKSYSIKEVYYASLTPEEAASRLRDLPATTAVRRQAKLGFQSR